MLDVDDAVVRMSRRTLHDAAQFAHVAWPVLPPNLAW